MAGPQQSARRVVRFGVFQVDLRAGELFKQGIKIGLQQQPLRVLALLLEHPGEVVTREDLRQAIWPAGTFVESDVGLDAAIHKLRNALGDSAENPRLVETLPRRGYRFIAAVDGVVEDQGSTAAEAVFATANRFAHALGAGAQIAAGRAVAGWGRPLRHLALGATVVGTLGVVAGAAILARRHGAGDIGAGSSVVVMPFENRTAVTELDPLGTVVAEWVTQGLTELPFLTVLDTRGAQAAARRLGAAATPAAVRRETGAGVVVAGSYVLQGHLLQFQAQISSTTEGSILLSIAGVTAPRNQPMAGVEALRQRRIAGAALDVFEGIDVFALPELAPSHPLLELDNVILTPHCSGSSVESTLESKVRGARHAVDVLLGRWPPHVVNPEVVPRFALDLASGGCQPPGKRPGFGLEPGG